MNYGTGTSLAVGALHGVGAETPTQVLIFLAAAGASGAITGVITLAVFLVGLFAANSALAVASASGYLAATKNFAVYATVSVVTALASLVLGTMFVLGREAWLPLFFGG
jgi:high-affinity nickel-transport protein